MGSMVIRNIPDDVLDRFKARARSKESRRNRWRGRSSPKRQAVKGREAREIDDIRARSKPVDMETAMRIMEEAREERDARPRFPGLDDDR